VVVLRATKTLLYTGFAFRVDPKCKIHGGIEDEPMGGLADYHRVTGNRGVRVSH